MQPSISLQVGVLVHAHPYRRFGGRRCHETQALDSPAPLASLCSLLHDAHTSRRPDLPVRRGRGPCGASRVYMQSVMHAVGLACERSQPRAFFHTVAHASGRHPVRDLLVTNMPSTRPSCNSYTAHAAEATSWGVGGMFIDSRRGACETKYRCPAACQVVPRCCKQCCVLPCICRYTVCPLHRPANLNTAWNDVMPVLQDNLEDGWESRLNAALAGAIMLGMATLAMTVWFSVIDALPASSAPVCPPPLRQAMATFCVVAAALILQAE